MRRYLFIFSFIAVIDLSAQEQINQYSHVRQLNMASVAWEDEDWPNEPFRDYLYRFFDYQMNMQKIKRRRGVFKLFETFESNQDMPNNILHDSITAQDLCLFAGKSPEDSYIAEKIDRTKTELGKVYLYGLISNPINNIDLLINRQLIFKYLINNQELLSECDAIYKQLADSENFILSLWQQDGFINVTERRYYSIPFFVGLKNYINSSSCLLEVKRLFGHQERMVWLGTGVLSIGILSSYGIFRLSGVSIPNLLERMALRLQGTGGRLLAFLSGLESPWLDVGALSLAGALSCSFSCKEDYEWTRDNIIVDLLLQKKMIIIAQFFRAVIDLNELLKQHPEFIKICPAASKINEFMESKAKEKDIQLFLHICQSSTLKGNESFFSYHGRALAAFKLVYECKEIIEPLLLCIGELDAYCSCARLFNEFEHQHVQFCFVDYKQDIHPSIRMGNFWNPMIDVKKVVTNDIYLQGPERRNMVITGPNAGGKSTLIKAIPLNLIFAQTIGIAAARSAEITPFANIATYLNIVDDIAAGNSLFKAQVLRAQEMVALVENTPTNQFSFVALDEMFNGTSANESMAAAYSVVNHIGKSENNICIVATHFPLLTQLEQRSLAFQNYKVSVNIDNAGIHYPFKLEKGISHQHVALDILKQEGYDCTILDEASQILNEVTG